MKKIGIIVLNWQNWPVTLACLESLQRLNCPKPVTLIVCDNHSEDDSWTQLRHWANQRFPGQVLENPSHVNSSANTHDVPCIILQTTHNLGFAGGMNVALRYVLNSQQFEYLWLLNNDVIVEPQSLIALYHCAQNRPQYALLGSTILNTAPPHLIQCAGGCRYSPWLTLFYPRFAGRQRKEIVDLNPYITLDYVCGAAMFLKVEALVNVGLFNENYFLFYEELDYSQRLKRQHYKIGWCPTSHIYHQGSATIGKGADATPQQLQNACYYENLSTLKYTWRFYPWLVPWVFFWRFSVKTLLFLLRKQLYLWPSLWQAYRDFLIPK